MLRRQIWIANAVVIVAILGAAGAIAVAAITWWPHAARWHAERRVPPPVTGAYATGGEPAGDPELAALLEYPLADLVIATDQDRAAGGLRVARRAALTERLLAPAAVLAHGPALARAWANMITALELWVHVPRSGRDYDAIVATFRDRVRQVSDELAAAGVGYYLEGDVVASARGAHAIVYAYRVEEVRFVLADGQPRRVLGLRRLDHLNSEHAMLGMQSEDLGDPVLLLDQIDGHVARKLVPVLEAGAPYPLGDAAWAELPEARAIRAETGDAVRAELGDASSTRALAQLIAASVRRHEAQHGLDDDRAIRLPYPAALADLIGDPDDVDGHPRNFADHCRNELSAYLSQIANDPVTPRTAYLQVAGFAFDRRLWGTPESYGAVVLSEGLARHLGGDAQPPVIHDGAIDRVRLAAAAHRVASAPPAALHAAARATWHDLYGEDITAIVDR